MTFFLNKGTQLISNIKPSNESQRYNNQNSLEMNVVKASVCASKTNTLKTCNSLVRNSTLDETCLDDKTIYLKKNGANPNKKLIVKIITTNGDSMSSEQRVASNKSSENNRILELCLYSVSFA